MNVSSSRSGPLFDGRAEAELANATDSILKTSATLGAADIRQTMNATFRTQTPFYRLKNVAKQEAPGWIIWDQGVIYGPWLEGTGSRNKTTRFKGYAIYRRSVAKIEARARAVGQDIIARFCGRMS